MLSQPVPERRVALVREDEQHGAFPDAGRLQAVAQAPRLGQPAGIAPVGPAAQARILAHAIAPAHVHCGEAAVVERAQPFDHGPRQRQHARRRAQPQPDRGQRRRRHVDRELGMLDAAHHQPVRAGVGRQRRSRRHAQRAQAGGCRRRGERQRMLAPGGVDQTAAAQVEERLPAPLAADVEVVLRFQQQGRQNRPAAAGVRLAQQAGQVGCLVVEARHHGDRPFVA